MMPSPDDQPTRPKARPWRWTLVLRCIAVLLLVLTALALSGSPSVKQPPPPSATNVDLARAVIAQLSAEDKVAGSRLAITLSQGELDGLSALVNQVLSPVRVEAQLVPPTRAKPAASTKRRRAAAPLPPAEMVVRLSRSLPLGAWLNVEARAVSAPAGKGLPIIEVTVGRVPLPAWLTRLALRRAWLTLQGDVENPRTLDVAMPFVLIGAKQAQAVVIHPGRHAAFVGLSRFGGVDPDPRWVARAYCELTRHADSDLAAVVRRAWRIPRPVRLTPIEQNRALVVAVAMRTIPEYRDRLAGKALPMVSLCINPQLEITLAGRNDLAKHWAMSAALSASLSSTIAQSLGVWKELSDSLAGGSGFSFVDITADRSGERYAKAATNPQIARFLQTRLAAVTGPQLLAPEALAKPEGLDAALFEQIYRDVESPEYASALAAIDVLLDNVGVPKP